MRQLTTPAFRRTPPAGHHRRLAALFAALCLALGVAAASLTGRGDSASASGGPAFRDERVDLLVFSEGEWWNAEIHALVHDDGSGAYAEAASAARAEILTRFPGAIEVSPAEVAAQYVLNPYWWPSHTAEWRYNPAGKTPTLTDDEAAIRASAQAWNEAGALWSFAWGGPTTAGTGTCSHAGRDGQNTVGWAAKSGATLAMTCTWYASGSPPLSAREFDMEIDPGWNWTTGTPVRNDLQSVVTHEFGHALGLGHPPNSECPGAVMCESYRARSLTRVLQPDDIAGVIAIYGAASVSTPPVTPSPTPPVPSPSPTVGPFRHIAPVIAKDQ